MTRLGVMDFCRRVARFHFIGFLASHGSLVMLGFLKPSGSLDNDGFLEDHGPLYDLGFLTSTD